MVTAATIVMGVMNVILAYLVRRLARKVQHAQACLDIVMPFLFGPQPGAKKKAHEEFQNLYTLPPPAPPPEEAPSPYAISNLPEELAAELEMSQRTTFGATSRTTFARTETDDHELELDDQYTSSLAVRIRELAGDEGEA